MDFDFDPIKTAGLTARTVDTVDRDGAPAKVVTAARTYPTSINDLWEAVTDIDRIPRWFAPVTGDLHEGGRFQVEGNAAGEVLTCDPPHRFDITWEFGGTTSWVTVELSGEPDADEARLELRHVAHVPDDLWDQFGPGAVGVGWDLALMGLDRHLVSDTAVDHAEAERWTGSADGRAFITAASSGWREAAIAGGDEPERARAAAENVAAFYTPDTPDDG